MNLYDALIKLCCDGHQLAGTLSGLRDRWERDPRGPSNWQLPTPAARAHRAKVDAEVAAREQPGVTMCWGEWVDLLEAMSLEFPAFKRSEEEAGKLVGTVVVKMDDPADPAPKTWTFRARDELGKLMDCCQVHKWGIQGHRFWMQAPDEPHEFLAALERVRLLARDLWCAGAGDEPGGGAEIAPEPEIPSIPKPKKLTGAQVDEIVGEYINRKRRKGVPIDEITRDGVANATGISTGRVSESGPWRALAREKEQAKVKDRPSQAEVDPRDLALDRLEPEDGSPAPDWGAVLRDQQKDQQRPTRDR